MEFAYLLQGLFAQVARQTIRRDAAHTGQVRANGLQDIQQSACGQNECVAISEKNPFDTVAGRASDTGDLVQYGRIVGGAKGFLRRCVHVAEGAMIP